MSTVPCMPYSQLPSLAGLLLKAAVSRKSGLKETTPLERIERSVTGARIEPDALAAFSRTCGYKPGESIPLPYYYVMAQRVQLALLTDPAFRLRIAGLIHVENTFRQYEDAALTDAFDMRCRIEGERTAPRGRTFDIVTDFFVNAHKALECRSGFLSRNRSHASGKNTKTPTAALEGDRLPLCLPKDAGRRYAKVSGDYNPIHLYALTARPFGFKQPIVQGMYMLSLVTACLEERITWSPKELVVEYKLPVYLPAAVDLIYRRAEDAAACLFEVRSCNDERLHLKGSLALEHSRDTCP